MSQIGKSRPNVKIAMVFTHSGLELENWVAMHYLLFPLFLLFPIFLCPRLVIVKSPTRRDVEGGERGAPPRRLHAFFALPLEIICCYISIFLTNNQPRPVPFQARE